MAMANVTVSCNTCGATIKISRKFFKRHQADSFEEYARGETHICRDCQFASHASKSAADSAAAKAAGLPRLTGSEKQIAWAETIRMDVISKVDNYILAAVNSQYHKFTTKLARTYFANLTHASDYIDGRNKSAGMWFTLIAKYAKDNNITPEKDVVETKKADKSYLFRRAHALTKMFIADNDQFRIDYHAQFAIYLRILYAELDANQAAA